MILSHLLKQYESGAAGRRRVLGPVDGAQMRAMYARGLTRREIARATGWAQSTVWRETRDVLIARAVGE